MTAADVLIETLIDWGVDTVFGMPGDGINGLMESLRTRQEKVRFVQVRHEESAAFMACGYAKVTGKLGVCLATSGPGGIHLLNGLYDAKLDGQPVLAITGLPYHDLIGTFTQQDVELDKLFMDVCVYNQRVMGPAHVENVTHLACRTALAYRAVTHIAFPVDLQDKPVEKKDRSKRNIPGHASDVLTVSSRLPAEADLARAAEILNAGQRVAILAGRGALHAGRELEALAETLAAPIAKPLLGKGVVPDDSPYTTGSVGLLGTTGSDHAMQNCDTLLMVGTSFPYIEFMPKPGQARCVQIDADPLRIGLRYPAEVGIVADSRKTLEALQPRLKRKDDRSFLEKAQAIMKDWHEYMDQLASSQDVPMKPQVIAAELGRRLAEDAIVTCDSGTIATWWARHIPAKRGQMHTLSGNLASMAPGLPYAIAAQWAYPERQVIAFVGDGGFSMLMAELLTAVKYKLPIKVVVVKNNYLGMIKWEQMVFLGNPEYAVDLQPCDFALFAKACGAEGFAVERPDDCATTVERFLATRGPAVLEATVDPFTAPMPANITAEQAYRFAQSLMRGEPNAFKIIQAAAKDKYKQLV